MDRNRYDVSSPYLALLQPESQASPPGSGCRSPGRVGHESLLEIESLDRLKRDSLPRIGSLGRSSRDDLLGPLGLVDPRAA